jgi:hypothetical protein
VQQIYVCVDFLLLSPNNPASDGKKSHKVAGMGVADALTSSRWKTLAFWKLKAMVVCAPAAAMPPEIHPGDTGEKAAAETDVTGKAVECLNMLSSVHTSAEEPSTNDARHAIHGTDAAPSAPKS